VQHVRNDSVAGAQALNFDIEQRIKQLEVILRWRDELRLKLGRAANDVEVEPDYDALSAEVEQFRLACKGARV
jgi:hypothetical protein